MNNNELCEMLIQLRKFVIDQFNTLDGSGEPTTAVVKQTEVADTYTTVIKSIEDLLKGLGVEIR
tara:strand:+ start:420 stop:611 length:192 start_codon:yes stop_codon:yes gene_type:complete